MIPAETFTVYAQYHEDIILAALLHKVERGFYVDVGANHEEYHSVTKYFYERGWRGINIEPIPRLIKEFEKKRKRDTNLELAVSTEEGELILRDYPKHDGLSTLDAASKLDESKLDLPYADYSVRVDRLDSIFKIHKVETIDFLKIDVEGYEAEVLRSNDWNKYRPTVICIEANHRSNDWASLVLSYGYKRAIFDGLNEYYLAIDSIGLIEGFAERATLLAHNSLLIHHKKQWDLDIRRIRFLEDITDKQDELIRSLQAALAVTEAELKRVRSRSFENKTFKQQIALSLREIVTDRIKKRSPRE